MNSLFSFVKSIAWTTIGWIWPPEAKIIPKKWWSNALVPGVDDCLDQIRAKNAVGRFPSVFYTSWGGVADEDDDLKWGVEGTKLWAAQNIPHRVVDFDGITTFMFRMTTETAIIKPFGSEGLNYPTPLLPPLLDSFLKNLSQAFAEESAGETWVVISKGRNFDENSCWAGWEYPALTRNPRISRIWQVELEYDNRADFLPGGRPTGSKTVLWTRGDPPSPVAPKGARQTALSSHVPPEYIPAEWSGQQAV
ncbi:hypothetical protein MMC07_006006 [Pseudocyphellaria aurata]|nr:hypothetical protein [Pseudocyphellaria aurata]